MPKFLSRMDVGEVDFNHRHIARSNSIAQSNARVCIAGGVEHNRFRSVGSVLNPSNQVAFIIALTKLNLGAPFSLLTHCGLNIHQRGGAVNVRLTLSKKV